MSVNNGDSDQTSHSAASDLGLLGLPMSHKNDARLIWVNNKRTTILEWTAAQATVDPVLIISTGKSFALKNGSLMIKLEFSGKIISEDFIDVLICELKIHQIFIERNGV